MTIISEKHKEVEPLDESNDLVYIYWE